MVNGVNFHRFMTILPLSSFIVSSKFNYPVSKRNFVGNSTLYIGKGLLKNIQNIAALTAINYLKHINASFNAILARHICRFLTTLFQPHQILSWSIHLRLHFAGSSNHSKHHSKLDSEKSMKRSSILRCFGCSNKFPQNICLYLPFQVFPYMINTLPFQFLAPAAAKLRPPLASCLCDLICILPPYLLSSEIVAEQRLLLLLLQMRLRSNNVKELFWWHISRLVEPSSRNDRKEEGIIGLHVCQWPVSMFQVYFIKHSCYRWRNGLKANLLDPSFFFKVSYNFLESKNELPLERSWLPRYQGNEHVHIQRFCWLKPATLFWDYEEL